MRTFYMALKTILMFIFIYIVLQSNVVVSSSSSSSTTTQKCVHSQWLALSQLRALNLHSPPLLPSYPCDERKSSKKVMEWNMEEEDCCSWDGVSCDPATGYVIGLDLSFSMLSGEIFPIFNLHHLQTLNLSCNNFNSTPFPSGFEKLRNLMHLNLSQTSFSGQIPVEISTLTRLVSLDLSSMFTASVELRKTNLECFFMNMSSLKEVYLDGVDLSAQASNWSQVLSSALPHIQVLSLSNCDLHGPIHPSFTTLKSLSYLQLSFNYLSSDFPENVFLLPKLKTIDISYNLLLSGQFPEFPKHTSLQTISLSQTKFQGELPESIGNLQSLKFLYISSCNLSGLFPSSLANLTSIIELDISYNRFTGSLPPFHSTSVPNLSYLDMSSNLLTGGIRSSLFTLPSLEYLHLDDNKFSGELEEFSNTSSSILKELYLNHNQLSGVVPKSIFQLPNLIHLALGSNNFHGSVKIEMLQNLKNLTLLDLSSISLSVEENDDRSFDLPQLQNLFLHKCNLSDFPIFLNSKLKLRYLNLADNHIRGYVPSWLGNNTLETLDLSGNPLDFLEPSSAQGNNSFVSLNRLVMNSCNISKFPKFLKGLDALKILDLSNNKIKGEIPSWIWKNQLQFVNISHNLLCVVDEFPSNISLNVFYLYLHGNCIKGSLPSGICNMSHLQVLDASDNKLSGLIPECLVKLASLSVLNLKGNRYDQMPSTFTFSHNNLLSLNLNGNRLKGKLPRSLANCKKLEILDLGNNMIYDTFPFWLEKLPSLKVLILRNNMFYGQVEISRTNFVLPTLRIIDLSSNNFTGELSRYFLQSLSAMAMGGENKSLPSLVGENDDYYHDSVTIVNKGYQMVLVKILTIFVALDLSNNKFYGNVPKEIGELKSLVVLNLSQNVFNRRIPISLGELSQLESLDFSKNKFSGRIPPQLASLTFLEVLNMSYNQLAGRIPLGNQFNTFTNSSYIGNTGLCGIPLSRKCNEDEVTPVAQDDESLESEEAMFDWRFAVAGCGFGLVVGLTIGFAFLAEWIIKWLVKQKKKKQQRRRNKKKAQLTVLKLRR